MTMRVPNELFILSPITDDPRLEGFALTEAPSVLGHDSLLQDITPGFADAEANPDWSQVELSDMWVPPRVIGRVATFNDYPGLNGSLPVFSDRAVRVLDDLLQPNGELLLLRSELTVMYYFYNITTVIDALDRGRSTCEFWSDPPTTAVEIDRFEFHRDELLGRSIFRLRELPPKAIVSDEFKRRVEDAELAGFDFARIWPLPAGQHWKTVARDHRRERGTAALKAQTLVLVLPLLADQPNVEERKLIDRLEDDLDTRLSVPSLVAPYYGCYEGSDTTQQSYRLFLSGPDVNRLQERVEPLLRQLSWPEPLTVVRRFGNLFESHAKEEFGTIG